MAKFAALERSVGQLRLSRLLDAPAPFAAITLSEKGSSYLPLPDSSYIDTAPSNPESTPYMYDTRSKSLIEYLRRLISASVGNFHENMDNSRPLVVIKGNELGCMRVEEDGRRRVDDAALTPSQKVGADKLIVVDANDSTQRSDGVGEAAGRSFAEGKEQLFLRPDWARKGDCKVHQRHVVDRYSDGNAWECGAVVVRLSKKLT